MGEQCRDAVCGRKTFLPKEDHKGTLGDKAKMTAASVLGNMALLMGEQAAGRATILTWLPQEACLTQALRAHPNGQAMLTSGVS